MKEILHNNDFDPFKDEENSNDILKPFPEPNLIQKSSSRIPDPEFQNIHPRMIYHIMNHIKMNGSVDSSEIIDIISKFKDINNPETIQ